MCGTKIAVSQGTGCFGRFKQVWFKPVVYIYIYIHILHIYPWYMNHFKPVLTPLCLFDAVVVEAAVASACIAETSAAQVSIMPWLSSACPPTRSRAGL